MKTNPVKGLLLYSYYSSPANILTFFAGSVFASILALITGRAGLFFTMAVLWITCFSSSFMISIDKESQARWTRFQLTMPIRRKDVILSKYLGHFLLLAIGVVFAGLFSCASFILHEGFRPNFLDSIYYFAPACIGGSLVSCALFYPLYYKVNANNGEVLAMICMAAGPSLNLFLIWLGSLLNLSPLISAGLCSAVSLFSFVASYMLSLKIYREKDI